MPPSLPPSQRLKLAQTLSALPKAQFDQLCFALDPPAGVVPDAAAEQGSRATILLGWVVGPGGCGLSAFLEALDLLAPGVFDPSEFSPGPDSPTSTSRIFLSYKRSVEPDEPVALAIYEALKDQHQVFIDQKNLKVGTAWGEKIAQEIFQDDALIVLLSEAATHSEMVQKEIELARQSAAQRQGRPLILPVRLDYSAPFPYPLDEYLDPLHWAVWNSDADTPRLIEELTLALSGTPLPISTEADKKQITDAAKSAELSIPTPFAQPVAKLEKPDQGTIRLESQFYISRPEDKIALEAIQQPGVTITIKGARQMGKSSLLMRVKEAAQQAGKQIAFLDFQLFDTEVLEDSDAFFQQFCLFLTDELDLDDCVADYWNRPKEGNRQRCTRYMRKHVLKQLSQPLVLAMDEVEGIFGAPFRTDFFGMLRSWHNQRASSDLWRKLDLALVTSTEPYQLIADLNQSPFNVGEVLDLDDFDIAQVTDLNQRHGEPLNLAQVQQLMDTIHGHPYLVRRALYLVASGQISATDLFEQAIKDRGPFGDHLRHHLFRLYDKPELVNALLQVIRNQTCPDDRIFFRLRGAGLIRRAGTKVVPRCQLYAAYFKEHLNG